VFQRKKNSTKKILAVNPWVTDFAFYDLWFKPLGLLYIATILKKKGYHIDYIDLIQNYTGKRKYGKGKIVHTEIEKPDAVNYFDRKYFRYGMNKEDFEKYLDTIEEPDFIIMTSFMTYWYPGIVQTARVLKSRFPNVPIILGGIYATLLTDHAKSLPFIDYVIPGNDFNEIIGKISEIFNENIDYKIKSFDDLPIIDYSFYSRLDSITTVNSIGCPFKCPYCAASILYSEMLYKSLYYVEREFNEFGRFDVKDVAFYDDAFLMHPQIGDILKLLANYKFRFHLPNGIHARFVTKDMANLLYSAEFTTIRLGYEVYDSDIQKRFGGKVNNDTIIKAISNLESAGYEPWKIGVYVLGGHPLISVKTLEEGIKFLADLGVRIYISEYSPVPKTPEGRLYYDETKEDPLLTNNSLRRFIKEEEIDQYKNLKNFVRKHNGEIAG